MFFRRRKLYRQNRHHNHTLLKLGLLIGALFMVGVAGLSIMAIKAPVGGGPTRAASPTPTPGSVPADAGKLLSATPIGETTVAETQSQSQYAYGRFSPAAKYGVKKTLITYRSYDVDGTPLTLHARVYQPLGVSRQPVFGFATGTTGMGDKCAPSTENVAVASWAGYDSHLTTYAGQGYATVNTDYEGMRDEGRLHHYMVGVLEGRAVLDSIKALVELNKGTDLVNEKQVFLAGYSQGGHAALWADELAKQYAPDLSVSGVIGYGAVVDVTQTLADVTNKANINWFGPYVLASYSDYYHDNYRINDMLLPKWTTNLVADVTSNCINTNIQFWGKDPAGVYPTAMLEALRAGTLSNLSPELARRLDENRAGTVPTKSPKLLNVGSKDDVVLPSQGVGARNFLCAADAQDRGPIHMKTYEGANHYNTMAVSFKDTVAWMESVRNGQKVTDDCAVPAA